MYKIPVYQPSLIGNEKKYVDECIDSSWISSKGKFVELFESKFAGFINVKYATSVTSGTTALHLALVTLGLGPGDEVIVPTLTYIASVNAITYTGATPVFVDSKCDTWQIDPSDVKRKITPKTKAIMAVHLYGHPCNMDELTEIAREHGLYLIEDCAEAIGSSYNGTHVGGFGDIAIFSFYGNKTITTGEGGMVVTNNKTLYDRAFHFKGQGLAKHRQYWHDVIGYNYRMTNVCAAIGLAQLENVETFLKKKRKIAHVYMENLSGCPLTFQTEIGNVRNSYWMVSVLVNQPKERDLLRNALESNGIETRPLFYPVHTMPMYSKKYHQFPVAEDLGWRGINLPSYPDLNPEQVGYICDQIKKFFKPS
jgi:perosamine synthetase